MKNILWLLIILISLSSRADLAVDCGGRLDRLAGPKSSAVSYILYLVDRGHLTEETVQRILSQFIMPEEFEFRRLEVQKLSYLNGLKEAYKDPTLKKQWPNLQLKIREKLRLKKSQRIVVEAAKESSKPMWHKPVKIPWKGFRDDLEYQAMKYSLSNGSFILFARLGEERYFYRSDTQEHFQIFKNFKLISDAQIQVLENPVGYKDKFIVIATGGTETAIYGETGNLLGTYELEKDFNLIFTYQRNDQILGLFSDGVDRLEYNFSTRKSAKMMWNPIIIPLALSNGRVIGMRLRGRELSFWNLQDAEGTPAYFTTQRLTGSPFPQHPERILEENANYLFYVQDKEMHLFDLIKNEFLPKVHLPFKASGLSLYLGTRTNRQGKKLFYFKVFREVEQDSPTFIELNPLTASIKTVIAAGRDITQHLVTHNDKDEVIVASVSSNKILTLQNLGSGEVHSAQLSADVRQLLDVEVGSNQTVITILTNGKITSYEVSGARF